MKITEFSADGLPSLGIGGLEYFHIAQIFDCGQCFRFEPVTSPAHRADFEGVAYGRWIRVGQDAPDEITLYNVTAEDFERIWRRYFALDADYGAIRRDIAARFGAASHGCEGVMTRAMEYGAGIRVLRQEPWETVCSFIISQNNNIPRIKKIIAALSEAYGARIETPLGTRYAFPTASALAEAGTDAIFALRTGFRAKYLYDAAVRVSTGAFDCEAVSSASAEDAMARLMEIKGIGPKVASCAMLFGFDKTEAFPVDVWMKRVLAKYYPCGLDVAALGQYAGIAQQYLFYFERWEREHVLED